MQQRTQAKRGSQASSYRRRRKTRPAPAPPATRRPSVNNKQQRMEWNVQYPKGGPINAQNSWCRKFWYKSRGPGTVGGRAAARFWPKLAATTHAMVEKRMGGWEELKTMHGYYPPGEIYSAAIRWGCASQIRGYGTGSYVRPCGCYELWCPMLDGHLGSKKRQAKAMLLAPEIVWVLHEKQVQLVGICLVSRLHSGRTSKQRESLCGGCTFLIDPVF